MKIYNVLILFFIINHISAQDTIYYNSKWEKVSSKKYDYFRIVSPYKKAYKFNDYYSSGQIQMEGLSKKKDSLIKQGIFNYFNIDGVKSKRITYRKNIKNGNYELYYKNGKLKEKGIYKKGKLNGLNTQYFENGATKRKAELKKGKYQGDLTYYNDRNIIIGKGKTKNDGWIGKWDKYDNEGNKTAELFYGNKIKIKEEKITFETKNHFWCLFDKKNYSDSRSYLIRYISNTKNRKDFIEDSPELNLVLVNDKNTYKDYYYGIEKLKTKTLNLSSKKIKVIDSYISKYLNNGIEESSQVYGLTDGNLWFYLQYPINKKHKLRDKELISRFIESIKIN